MSSKGPVIGNAGRHALTHANSQKWRSLAGMSPTTPKPSPGSGAASLTVAEAFPMDDEQQEVPDVWFEILTILERRLGSPNPESIARDEVMACLEQSGVVPVGLFLRRRAERRLLALQEPRCKADVHVPTRTTDDGFQYKRHVEACMSCFDLMDDLGRRIRETEQSSALAASSLKKSESTVEALRGERRELAAQAERMSQLEDRARRIDEMEAEVLESAIAARSSAEEARQSAEALRSANKERGEEIGNLKRALRSTEDERDVRGASLSTARFERDAALKRAETAEANAKKAQWETEEVKAELLNDSNNDEKLRRDVEFERMQRDQTSAMLLESEKALNLEQMRRFEVERESAVFRDKAHELELRSQELEQKQVKADAAILKLQAENRTLRGDLLLATQPKPPVKDEFGLLAEKQLQAMKRRLDAKHAENKTDLENLARKNQSEIDRLVASRINVQEQDNTPYHLRTKNHLTSTLKAVRATDILDPKYSRGSPSRRM